MILQPIFFIKKESKRHTNKNRYLQDDSHGIGILNEIPNMLLYTVHKLNTIYSSYQIKIQTRINSTQPI